MEELQVIETTSGRQFKPWASREDVQTIKQETVQAVGQAVQDPASVTAITSEIASGKQAIASAINAKGGTASAAESFNELAEAVEEMPNFDYMARLAGIIAGGNYNKNILQGHNENVKYGKTEIVDNVGAFEAINVSYCFQNWDLLERVVMPGVTEVRGGYIFHNCSVLKTVEFPNVRVISGQDFLGGTAMEVINFPNLERFEGSGAMAQIVTTLREFICPKLNYIQYSIFRSNTNLTNVVIGTLTSGNLFYEGNCTNLRNITIGEDTNINLPFQLWTATNVIAEGQSGIDELNTNLQINLISKLYQGGGKILRLGAALYDVTTQETRDMVTSKGWTLQRG